MIVQCGFDQAVDPEIKARRLIPRELAVVQVGFVHNLGDRPNPAILDAEALDEGLERAVLAVVAEVGTEDVERDALAGSVGGIGKGEPRVWIAETLDEPRRPDPVDVRAGTRHPRAAARWQRCSMAPTRGPWPRFGCPKPLGRRLPESV